MQGTDTGMVTTEDLSRNNLDAIIERFNYLEERNRILNNRVCELESMISKARDQILDEVKVDKVPDKLNYRR